MRRRILVFFLVLGSCWSASAQSAGVGIGEWQFHSSFSEATDLVEAGEHIYCASALNFFRIRKSDGSFDTFSKLDGFSELGITALGYSEERDILLVGYKSGNIDLVHDNTIININDIERSNISGSKEINHVTFIGQYAYLSCDFALVLLDLENLEVKESYRNIGTDGEQLEIFSSATSSAQDSIYLATSEGLLVASLEPGINLLDFNNWEKLRDQNGNLINETDAVAFWDDTLYVARRARGIFKFSNGLTTKLPTNDLSWSGFSDMRVTHDKLIWCQGSRFGVLDNPKDTTYKEGFLIGETRSALVDSDGRIWAADKSHGLIAHDGEVRTKKSPNGPETANAFRFLSFDDQIFVLSGGYNNVFSPEFNEHGFSFRENGKWEVRSSRSGWIPSEFDFRDVNSGDYNPITDKYYFGGFKTGLLMWDRNVDTFFQWLDTTQGSTLSSALDDVPWVKITGVAVDEEGNTWVTNHETRGGPSLHKIDKEGNFQGYTLSNSDGEFPIDIDLGLDGTKWISLAGPGLLSGVIAYNDETKEERYLTNALGNGGLPAQQVRSLELDKDGAVWVGTVEGVGVFFEPENVFNGTAFDATLPIFEGRPLLQDEEVKVIAVDGANRKWFGTTSGVFLFDDNATEAIVNFNTENSVLPSNNIEDIEVVEKTGEVFISTDQGIVSYRGTATEGQEFHSNVSIFPNPVRSDFDGMIGISGLSSDAVVKITDISGKLVYETDAEGGLATWDALDINGKRATTGVYYVFSASLDGEDAFVGKIAVVE